MPGICFVVGQDGGTCANRDAEKGQRPDTDEGYTLRERQRLGERVAERIPGKPAEQVATQPFCAGQGGGERQNSFRSTNPHQACRGETERRIKREVGRQSRYRNRQQPAKGLGVDKESVADPVKTGDEISEAETPAGDGRGYRAAPAPGGGAVDEPDEDCKRHKQDRPGIDRRHCQRGRNACGKRYERPLPSESEHNAVCDAGEGHGWRAPAGPASFEVAGESSAPAAGAAPVASFSTRRRVSRGRSRRSLSRTMRMRLTRRGSASRTSNSNRSGPGTISPRSGRRPARVTR